MSGVGESHERCDEGGFPPELKDVHEQLRQAMGWLHCELKAYRDLFITHANHQVLRESIPDLARVIEYSLVTSIVVGLTRFTQGAESGGQNLTLPHLLDVLRDHGKAPELHERCRKRVEPFIGELASLKKFRNKAVAHWDRSTALQMEPARLPMPVEKICQVCSELADVLNDIDAYFTGSETAFESPIEIGGGEALIQHLRRAIRGFNDDERVRLLG